MKYLVLLMLSVLFAPIIHAQLEINQPKYVLKTNILNIPYKNFKAALDIARNPQETIEIQLGVKMYLLEADLYRPHTHLAMRYKYDMIEDDENLAGIYCAAGLEGGQWRIREIDEGNPAYLNLLADLGFQTNMGDLNLDFFAGIGFTFLDGGNFNDSQDGIIGKLGYELTPTGMNEGQIVYRLGTRVGINF